MSAGNFWQCLGVFLLSWSITLGGAVVLILLGNGVGQINGTLGDFTLTVGST